MSEQAGKIDVLKSIDDLLRDGKCKFFIPSYQRGYRWKYQQVEDLLNDIQEFSANHFNNTEKSDNKIEKTNIYYCLQPLIVKERTNTIDGKGDWEVIDGQQRLTTFYLILHYLNINVKENISDSQRELFSRFEIRYETRDLEDSGHSSHDFLTTIHNQSNEESKKNVDYLFMFNAYKAIKNWFNLDKNKIDINIIFNKIKFIWHEIESKDGENPQKVFERINTGKIKLSNAELIKALFLQRKNFDGHEEIIRRKQLEIAMEWDKIEYTLQNDEFWYFLNKEKCQSPTRIEFIFDLIANKQPKDREDEDFSFRHFYNHLKEKKDEKEKKPYTAITDQWKEVRKYYLTFSDWYHDIELYHYVGFLIITNEHLPSIIKDYKEKTKDEFKKSLVSKIKNAIKSENIEKLNYSDRDNYDLIKRLLILFNIQYTYLNNKDKARFPFHSYNSHKWSLEHIHAQNSENLTTPEQWLEWFNDHRNILNKENNEHEKLSEDIDMMTTEIKEKFPDEQQRKEKIDSSSEEMNRCLYLHGKLLSLLDSEGQAIESDGIENLALLERNQNTSLGNSIFAVKRQKIMVIDKRVNSVFVPACTRYAFMKYFTEHPSQFYFWSRQDANNYLDVIRKTLKDYLPEQLSTKGQ